MLSGNGLEAIDTWISHFNYTAYHQIKQLEAVATWSYISNGYDVLESHALAGDMLPLVLESHALAGDMLPLVLQYQC